MEARATYLIAGAGGVTLGSGIRFPNKISVVVGALSDIETPYAKGLA